MTSLKYDISLLDRNTRFLLWQVKIRAMLAHMDLDNALLGFDKMPANWTTKDKQQKYRKALAQIHLHLSNNILQDVLKEKMADALWWKLEQLCTTKSLTSKLHLKQMLYSHRMTEGGSLEDHLAVFKEIVADLETLEEKMKHLVGATTSKDGDALVSHGDRRKGLAERELQQFIASITKRNGMSRRIATSCRLK